LGTMSLGWDDQKNTKKNFVFDGVDQGLALLAISDQIVMPGGSNGLGEGRGYSCAGGRVCFRSSTESSIEWTLRDVLEISRGRKSA